MNAGLRAAWIALAVTGLLGLAAYGFRRWQSKSPMVAAVPAQTHGGQIAAESFGPEVVESGDLPLEAQHQNDSRGASRRVDCTVLPYTPPATVSAADEAKQSVEDVRGGMDCPFPVGAGVQPLTLHFAGRPDNTLGDIQVLQRGKLLQTITGHEVSLDALYPAGLDMAAQSVDANFDGYQDLELLNDCGATGNCDYDFYLYDPAQGQFVPNGFLSGLGTPEFHPAKRQVTTSWNMGAGNYSSSVYELRNTHYVEIKRTASDEKGIRSYERKNGKMVLVSTRQDDQ